MDSKTIFYFYELTRDLNMTKTANRLFISQQTLSNRIFKLEEELQVKLFYRKPSLELTPAGKAMLEFSVHILFEEEDFKKKLLDINNSNFGTFSFGASSLRMNATLPNILNDFYRRFPNVNIELIDGVSKTLEPLIKSGNLDLALIASNKIDSKLEKENVMKDQIFFCVSSKLLVDYYGKNILSKTDKFMKGVDLSEFSELPFLIYENRLGRQISKCFLDKNITPNIYMKGSYMQVITSIGFLGIAAFFSTQLCLKQRENEIPDDLNIFPVIYQGSSIYQDVSIITNKSRYKPKYLIYFIELLKEFFSAIESQNLVRCGKYF